MVANKKPEVAGLKLVGMSVPLFPETEAEIYGYGEELAAYMNGEKRNVKWLPYCDGAADMLRRWAKKLPVLPPRMLRDIAKHTETIQLERSYVAAPIRKGEIQLRLQVELDIPKPFAGVAYLLSSILSAGYGNNLRLCKKRDCDLWFFDVPKGRRIKEYCCKKHSDSERQRRDREKKKAEKRRHRK